VERKEFLDLLARSLFPSMIQFVRLQVYQILAQKGVPMVLECLHDGSLQLYALVVFDDGTLFWVVSCTSIPLTKALY